MKKMIVVCIAVMVFSCKNDRSKEDNGLEAEPVSRQDTPVEEVEDLDSEYNNTRWGVEFNYPEGLQVYEGELGPNFPVINIFPEAISQSPPFGIHEDAELGYITIIPKGYGVDGPSGTRKTLQEWEGNLPLTFNLDRRESMVYLLETGEAWAYSLRFHQPPEKWNEYGTIFIKIGVENFRAECEDGRDGESIPVEDCDPLAGDQMKFYGQVNEKQEKAFMEVLRNLRFFTEADEEEPISSLIQPESPVKGQRISSPLEISGKARGYWFFEGQAPYRLLDKDYSVLAEGAITAQEEWMTEDFIPFEATAQFSTSGKERGYLVLNRANASGKPEHDRSFWIPVSF